MCLNFSPWVDVVSVVFASCLLGKTEREFPILRDFRRRKSFRLWDIVSSFLRHRRKLESCSFWRPFSIHSEAVLGNVQIYSSAAKWSNFGKFQIFFEIHFCRVGIPSKSISRQIFPIWTFLLRRLRAPKIDNFKASMCRFSAGYYLTCTFFL